MLNELKPIASLLQSRGVFKRDWRLTRHSKLLELNKSPTFRAIIVKGLPKRLIEVKEDENILQNWFKFGPASGPGLTVPAFNFNQNKEYKNILSLKKCAGDLKGVLTSLAAFSKMLDEIISVDDNKFLKELKNLLKSKDLKEGVTVQIVLDRSKSFYSDMDFFKKMNDNLMESIPSNKEGTNTTDALGVPCNAKEFHESFPSCNTKLGRITIRCLDSNTPCRATYGVVGSETYPVSDTMRRELAGAFRFLVSEENINKTWKLVETKKDAETKKVAMGIFISYATDKALQKFCEYDCNEYDPDDLIQQAEDFIQDYRSASGKVFDAESTEESLDGVQLMLLDKKTSKSYAGFTFSERVSAEGYVRALKKLAEVVNFLKETIYGYKREKVSSHYLIKQMHTHFGTTAKRVDIIRPVDLSRYFRIFYFENDNVYLSQIMMNTCLSNSLTAINSYVCAKAYGNKSDFYYAQEQIHKIAEIFAYFLLRTKTKEEVVNHPMYLLGRMCNLYDQLHEIYLRSHNCKGYTIPVGSEAFKVGLTNPLDVSRILSRRSYLKSFIKKLNGEDQNKARSIEKSLSILSVEISKSSLPTTSPKPEDIHHFHLGFLNSNWFINTNTNTNKGVSDEKQN